MQDILELTPELLLEQSQEMLQLRSDYENLFTNVSSDLRGMNNSWSALLSNNFSGKIGSAQKAFSGTLTMLQTSAESIRSVAVSLQELDAQWASKIGSDDNTCPIDPNGPSTAAPESAPAAPSPIMDVSNYSEKASHAEYAALCMLWQKAVENANSDSGDPMKYFLKNIKDSSYIPESDPLKHLTKDQLIVMESVSGFSALAILDKDTAIVTFAGTDPAQVADYVADAQLVFGQPSAQSVEANALVAALSTKYSDIVVTGHSLGGYLATSATLNNDAVSSCIAFDAPGRTDAALQSLVNSKRASKVITYNAEGSGISWVGDHVGETPEPLDVKENFLNHGIKEICDALGGKKAIAEKWN